jgi:hypothetical protein
MINKEMSNWKKSPVFQKWKTNVSRAKTTRKTKKQASHDMCTNSDFCKGAKDIPRKLMPQIYDAAKFAKTIKKKYNINSEFTKAPMAKFRPSQNEINKHRVKDVIGAIKAKKLDSNPLVVSEDGYIIDGHHRWAAYKKLHPDKHVPVLVIKKPVHEALGLAIAATPDVKREVFG